MTADEAADPHAQTPGGGLDDQVVRQSLDAIIATDTAFVVTTWNPAAERIYGIEAADVVGREFRDVVETLSVDGRPLDTPAAEAELAASGSWRGRVIHRPRIGSRAGRDIVVDSVAATLRGADGSATGVLGINRDVTATASLEAEIAALGSLVVATDRARTKAEVAHAALEILVRATGADAGLVTSTDSTYEATAEIGVNQRTIDVIVAYGQLGGPLARALDAPDAYVSADVATAPLREDVREAVLADGIRHLIVVGLRLAGRLTGILALGWRREAPIEPSPAIVHQAAALVASSIENARLLAAVEAGLREERLLTRRYRDLFESSPEALLVEDERGIVVDANPGALRLYGEGLIGRSAHDLVGSDAAPAGGGAVPVLNATGIGRRLDGSTFPEQVELRPLDIGGEPHVLAIVRDLTDAARMQSELVQAQKMEAIGLLVAGVAHELNNPLASIVAFSQLIRSDPNLPADLRTQADLLVQEANRTRVIVQNLLDFARQRPPERVRTELRPLVESVLALQSYVLSRNQLRAEIDIPDDLPPLLVDRAQIQQVLVNLTFNSAQAIHDAGRPGTIRIEARRVGGDGDPVGAPGVRLAIRDDGPGVAPDVTNRLFEPFVTTKAPGEGTGLGLSVSFGIVTAHGGTLRHEPTPGGGATFVVELPVEATPRAGVPASSPAAAGSATSPSASTSRSTRAADTDRPRILVLDDEPSIREFLARALVRYGYEPVLAATGPVALEIVRSDPPAAILCDHRMAGMSGTDFHAAVGEIAPDLSGRFAFMSGDVLNPQLREFAADHGVQLLAKPFDLSTVETVVRGLLAERD